MGRPKGALNKTTRAAKEAIALAADELGGSERLVAWAKEDPANERAFWTTIYPKLIPVDVHASGGLNLNITRDFSGRSTDPVSTEVPAVL
jgi:hypothetical protein